MYINPYIYPSGALVETEGFKQRNFSAYHQGRGEGEPPSPEPSRKYRALYREPYISGPIYRVLYI